MNTQRWATALLMAVLLVTAACADRLRNETLADVAKDWSLVVRASQIIPVYPLTEDLQPGDLFLVQSPIDHQQRLYTRHGFLPLETLIRRLHPDGYQNFYGHSFGWGAGFPYS